MKKLFALVALVLGVVSCQTDPNDLDLVVGGEQEVMINVALAEGTRAGSADGALDNGVLDNYQLRYILEIYLGENCSRQVIYSNETTVSFPVRLAPGRAYDFVVWADFVAKGTYAEDADADLFYETSAGLDEISIIDGKPMTEARDAFYGVYKLAADKAVASISTIELKRPFAKIRVVTTDIEDLNKISVAVPTSAKVTYKSDVTVYNKFNARNGEVSSDNATKEYTFSYANTYEIKDGKMTLFADYLFVPENGSIVKFDLDVTDHVIKSFNTEIPVNRNKLTTIKGDILTEGGDINVDIEDEFGGESGIEDGKTFAKVDTVEEFLDAINKGIEKITLEGDIDLNALLTAGTLSTRAAEPTYGLIIPAGKSVVLDLKGFTISQSKECKASYSMIQNNGNLTIIDSSEAKSGKISFKDTSAGDPNFGWGSYTISNYGGTLVVENGTIEHLGEQNTATEVKHMICAIFQYSGSTTINGGTISTPTYRSARLWSGDMTINGGEFEGQLWLQAVNNTSNLTINGGTFAPRGKDGSSVFVTNSQYDVKFAVTGGFFNTKIGCNDANKAGVKGCIVGGTFTANAIENTNAALIAEGYIAEADGDLFNVIYDPFYGYAKVNNADELSAALADSQSKIYLAAGEVFEGTFAPKVNTEFVSDSENKATIKGRVNTKSIDISFENIKFACLAGHSDKAWEGPGATAKGNEAIVMIENAASSFENCDFEIDATYVACAINNHNAAADSDKLTVNNCTFAGNMYAIKTRTHFNITNSTFDIDGPNFTIYSVFTWGVEFAASAVFSNNRNLSGADDFIGGVQFTSTTHGAGIYDNLTITMNGNSDFIPDAGFNTTNLNYTNSTFNGVAIK